MSVAVPPVRTSGITARDASAVRPRIGGRTTDAWPHTTRLLPWTIAGFLTMVWIVPFDAISIPSLPLPVESTLDRVLMPVILACSAAWLLTGRARGNLGARVTAIDGALFFLLGVSALSILLNAQTLVVVDELELSIKKLAILASLMVFFYLVVTGVRRDELSAFSTLTVVLAALAGLGVIYEYRTGTNVFYDWSESLLPGLFSIAPATADPQFGREAVTGPTSHAIAMATALSIALPLAMTGFMRSATSRQRFWHMVAITLILAGCIATVRRTGALGPVAALVVLVLYRPRPMLRLLPFGLMIVLATQILAPGAPTRVKAQVVNLFGDSSDRSVEGRTDDYDPVTPDIRHRIVAGRGYGSYDPSHHRFLDNEWLARVIETGIIGALAYLSLVLAVIRVSHRASRLKDPVLRSVGVSGVAAATVYGVTSFVFDALSFPQAPYLFLAAAAFSVVALGRPGDETPAGKQV